MVRSLERYTDGFPHPTIPVVHGTPQYEDIAAVHLQLNANAASVHCPLGNGSLGWLALTVSNAEYNALSGDIDFAMPANPGPYVAMPNGTQAQIRQHQKEHEEATELWREMLVMEQALKQQVLACFGEMFYRTLRHRVVGYTNVSTFDILTHLYDTYGKLTPIDMEANDTRFRTPFNTEQPFEVLVDQVEDAMEVANAAGVPYTSAQVVSRAYALIFDTNQFVETCREWRMRPQAQKTWSEFKTFFADAYQEMVNSRVTTGQQGFQANHAQGEEPPPDDSMTAEALANLAQATAADRNAVALLTSTNAALTAQLAEANAAIARLQAEAKSAKQVRSARQTNGEYCWTHGHRVATGHNSATCRNPAHGHQKEATAANTLGGSAKGATA